MYLLEWERVPFYVPDVRQVGSNIVMSMTMSRDCGFVT